VPASSGPKQACGTKSIARPPCFGHENPRPLRIG
jgi:hypothetical protein